MFSRDAFMFVLLHSNSYLAAPMKLLSLCDPARYLYAPLDVPTFYQKLSQDNRVEFYHLPSPEVFTDRGFTKTTASVLAIASNKSLTYNDFLSLGSQPQNPLNLADIDLVFCRTLKPFSAGYLDRLAQWETVTRFVNSPLGKQTQMRADFLSEVARDYIPDTLVTASCAEAIAFFEQHQTLVAKQSNSCGGRGVFKIWYQSGYFQVDNILTGVGAFTTFAQVMQFLQNGQAEPLQFCRYLHRTQEGDKRVVVVDGEIYGSYLRQSRSGHWVNNASQDGDCTLADISDDERTAIQQTVGRYQALGLHTLGYDFLRDDDGSWKISEINAGNIGGFARLELLTGKFVMNRFTDWLLSFSGRPYPSKVPRFQPNLKLAGVA